MIPSFLLAAAACLLQEPQPAPEVVVTGRSSSLVGEAATASEGRVGREELDRRPLLRPGEVLETIPGLIVTQHSGGGKANQYFLRGFNLDHGTDFATWIDGMPVNQPSHGHGQGYTDLNFLIPELVERVDYRKGPYHASEGDFSSAGAARLRTHRALPTSLAHAELGEFGHRRGLLAHSLDAGDGRLLFAVESLHYDGPWEVEEDLLKTNAFVRWSAGTEREGWDVTFMGYQGEWTAADQVPLRAVRAGTLDRYGVIDPTDGGKSRRFSLSGEWRGGTGTARTTANAYVIESRLRLFSNFTYFLDDPVDGDQFEQVDQRIIVGAAVRQEWTGRLLDAPTTTRAGIESRNDVIGEVGLHSTSARVRRSTTRDDEVLQNSAGLWIENETRWTPWFRSVAGLRGDVYRWDVESSVGANSGTESDAIASPKGSLVFGPWAETEAYVSAGLGFHSNDGRGATIRVDPVDGVTPVDPVDPLVCTKGVELGLRTTIVPGLQTSVVGFGLDSDSELLFIGDAGITEPSRPSRRTGVEWSNFYRPLPWLTLDADLAWTKARFKDSDPAGDHVPGAAGTVIAAGISVQDLWGGVFGALRLRYFGPRDLVEDGSERSDDTTLLNAELGWQGRGVRVALEVFNLLDSDDDDITYLYDSQLQGEATPTTDRHIHPVEPRAFRLAVTIRF